MNKPRKQKLQQLILETKQNTLIKKLAAEDQNEADIEDYSKKVFDQLVDAMFDELPD